MPEADLLAYCRRLYEEQGFAAFSFKSLTRHEGLYTSLYRRGLAVKTLIKRLGLEAEYRAYKLGKPLIRGGRHQRRWSWERVVESASAIRAELGFLPPAGWFRENGYQSLVQFLYRLGKTWEELRQAVGDSASGIFVKSRSGIRWRSHPEASLSNFLFARGIEHRRGDRYPEGYELASGRAYGIYDLHFRAGDRWMDVEIWGDNPGGHDAVEYQAKRKSKEEFNKANPNFLGIHYEDCYSDKKLSRVLEPYIGLIAAFRFERSTDPIIQSTHWSNTDELLECCREIAHQMPDGKFPTEEWLRKRGKHADRPGPAYNTVSIYINRWFGGIRQLRSILGQAHHSTTAWTREDVASAWLAFCKAHNLTPNQVRAQAMRGQAAFSSEVLKLAGRLVSAAVKYAGGADALNKELGITVARRRICRRHGRHLRQADASRAIEVACDVSSVKES